MNNSCEYCRGVAYTKNPFTVVTQLGRVVHVVFNYCPVCGRRLIEAGES